MVIDLPPLHHAELRKSMVIAYATGQIVRQADAEVIAAFDLLAARAAELGQSLHDTALDVLDGVIRFAE